MANPTDFDLSELERELELDSESFPDEGEFEADADSESLFELDDSAGAELEFEGDGDSLGSLEYNGPAASYGDRLYELAERSFEGPVDAPLNEILDEMSREYFLGSLGRRLRRGLPGVAKLVRSGVNLARKAGVNLPVLGSLRNITGLAQNLLQGNLSGVAKHALGAALKAYPGTAALAPALSALGFEAGEPEQNRAAWQNFAEVARESYEYLGNNFNETSVQPDQAIALAQRALQHGLRQARRSTGRRQRSGNVRVVRLAPGERLMIVCSRQGA